MERSGDEDLRKIAIGDLDAWKQSGVVKALKYFSAEDEAVCSACKARHGAKHCGRIDWRKPAAA
jgi:hypothetical protein